MAATAHTNADIDWAVASLGILLNGLLLRNFAEAGRASAAGDLELLSVAAQARERQADEADAENLCEACVAVVLQWVCCGQDIGSMCLANSARR